jgi:hypothetical protein
MKMNPIPAKAARTELGISFNMVENSMLLRGEVCDDGCREVAEWLRGGSS